MPVNRELPAGIASRREPHAAIKKQPSGLNVARFITREEELHQARAYTNASDATANRARWEEKQNLRVGSGARSHQQKQLAEEMELMNRGANRAPRAPEEVLRELLRRFVKFLELRWELFCAFEALEHETERLCTPDSAELEALETLLFFEFAESLLCSRSTLKLELSFGCSGDVIPDEIVVVLFEEYSVVAAKTLADPAGKLVYRGNPPNNASTKRKTNSCCAPSSKARNSTQLQLPDPKAQNGHIISTEREDIDSSHRNGSVLEWMFNDQGDSDPLTPEVAEIFGLLLDHLGSHVASLRELYDYSDSEEERPTAPTMNECRERIEACAQGELLPCAFKLHQKLAFLSAIQRESTVSTARQDLDSFMVFTIFKFSADRVRRRIVWVSVGSTV